MHNSDDFLLDITTIEADTELNHRERERKAVLRLLRRMLNNDEVTISHNSDGKPTIPGYYISISHTRGYAAIAISKSRPVGVDIEYQSNRVERIVQRFLRTDEIDTLNIHSKTLIPQNPTPNAKEATHNTQCTTLNALKAWCAKEAVYKYYSEDHLAYAEMRCTIADSNHFYVENLKRGETVSVAFKTTDAYVLAWVQ